jgi:hypothetical protein
MMQIPGHPSALRSKSSKELHCAKEKRNTNISREGGRFASKLIILFHVKIPSSQREKSMAEENALVIHRCWSPSLKNALGRNELYTHS